jgi:hypothetical protein
MTCLLALLPAVGHDQLWCLYVAQRMLHGVKLYGPELLESNPPLIMWMLVLPATVARLFHLPVTLVFKAGIVLLQATSALVCLGLLRRSRSNLTRANLWALAFAFVAITGALPARDFGQREHLLVLLCLPYVLAAALDSSSHLTPHPSRLAEEKFTLPLPGVAIGIAAGIGFSLKPHQLLVPIALEAAVLLHRRSFRLRPEAVALLATCLAYLAAIRLVTPNYLTGILPILRDTYWAIGNLTFSQLFFQSLELHILAAVTLTLFYLTRKVPSLWCNEGRPSFWRSQNPRIGSSFTAAIPLLLIAGSASTLAYYLQGTGWYYQQIPALSFFAFALVLELIDLFTLRPITLPTWTPKAAAALSVLAITLTAYFSGYTFSRPLVFPSGLSTTPDPSFFANFPAGTPVAILTTVVDDSVPPIATHHLLWAQRQNNLWTLPAILRNESPTQGVSIHRIPPARLAELDRLQHLWMVEDLARWHPALILVARCQDPTVHCQILEDRHDDLLAWFARDPSFRAAFAHYHYLRSSGPYDAYIPD